MPPLCKVCAVYGETRSRERFLGLVSVVFSVRKIRFSDSYASAWSGFKRALPDIPSGERLAKTFHVLRSPARSRSGSLSATRAMGTLCRSFRFGSAALSTRSLRLLNRNVYHRRSREFRTSFTRPALMRSNINRLGGGSLVRTPIKCAMTLLVPSENKRCVTWVCERSLQKVRSERKFRPRPLRFVSNITVA